MVGTTLGLRVLDTGTSRETTGITISIGDNLCHKIEGTSNEHLDLDTHTKQHKIKPISAKGNVNYIRQHDRMSLIKYSRFMSALEKRVLHYCRKGQEVVDTDKVPSTETIGKTGTISTEGLTDSDDSSQGTQFTLAQATYLANEEISGVSI